MANQVPLSCISLCLFTWFQGFFSFVHGDTNLSQPFLTPINRDLYHSSGDLMEEIKALVIRHPDECTLDTIKARNNGYCWIDVVTYCRRRQESDDKLKFRILLSLHAIATATITKATNGDAEAHGP